MSVPSLELTVNSAMPRDFAMDRGVPRPNSPARGESASWMQTSRADAFSLPDLIAFSALRRSSCGNFCSRHAMAKSSEPMYGLVALLDSNAQHLELLQIPLVHRADGGLDRHSPGSEALHTGRTNAAVPADGLFFFVLTSQAGRRRDQQCRAAQPTQADQTHRNH